MNLPSFDLSAATRWDKECGGHDTACFAPGGAPPVGVAALLRRGRLDAGQRGATELMPAHRTRRVLE